MKSLYVDPVVEQCPSLIPQSIERFCFRAQLWPEIFRDGKEVDIIVTSSFSQARVWAEQTTHTKILLATMDDRDKKKADALQAILPDRVISLGWLEKNPRNRSLVVYLLDLLQ